MLFDVYYMVRFIDIGQFISIVYVQSGESYFQVLFFIVGMYLFIKLIFLGREENVFIYI